jgi:CheY-like chemotaxis protein
MGGKFSRDALKGWTILVVDDEPDSLEVAMRVLRHYGATVITAANGVEGMTVVHQTRPRLIITDLSMPDLDGWGFLYELKQDRATMHVPIFALTAHAMAGDRERAIAAGFHNYLTKPLTPATFMEDLMGLIEADPQLAQHVNAG